MRSHIDLFFCIIVTLLAIVAAEVPTEWRSRVRNSQMLYSEKEPRNEIMTFVGNGYLATQINTNVLFIGGVYNGRSLVKDDHSRRAVVPAFSNIAIMNGTLIAAAIDIERAIYYRRVDVGGAIVEQRWYAHRKHRNLLVHEIELLSDHNKRICGKQDLGDVTRDITFEEIATGSNSTKALHGYIRTTESPTSKRVQVTIVYPSSISSNPTCFTLLRGTTFYYPVVITTDLEEHSDVQSANTLWLNLNKQKHQLQEDHINEWSKLWTSGLEVAGNDHLARSLNGSLYYILSSIRDDWHYSLSPGGLASDAYGGHVFWDMETWMYPNLLSLYPRLAKSGLQYRFNRLDEARQKAKSYNPPYSGIMFPWESAFTGGEVCGIDIATGAIEQHISGDVVFAVRQYYYSEKTSDEEKQKIWELVSGVAEFFQSRVSKRKNGQWDINGIIPPDEYAENINNSIYTNVVAQISFEFAIELAKDLGKTAPEIWSQIAQGLYMPSNGTIHLEYEGYDGRGIKQADVILLGYPLNWKGLTKQSRRADLEFYEKVTDKNGPSMTWSMHTVGFLELDGKETEKSKDLFKRSYATVQQPYYVWREGLTGGAINFITGAGGFLQAYLNGYGGLRINKSSLTFNPILSDGTVFTRLRGVNYLGNVFNVEYDEHTVSITLLSGNSLIVTDAKGQKTRLEVGNSHKMVKSAFSVTNK